MAPRGTNTAALGIEAALWKSANQLRSTMDPAAYKHVVLGLLFLKFVSDNFEERRQELASLAADPDHEYYLPEDQREELLEDRDAYTEAGVFWIPAGHRWSDLRDNAKSIDPPIGKRIDNAMRAIEDENPSLQGVLPKIFSAPEYASTMLGGLIDTFSNSDLAAAERAGLDVLGRVYEYFLAQFASAEGKGGGQYYTPSVVVRLLVEMLRPYRGRIYDPACGSGGMFVQAERFVRAHSGQRNELSVYGQESNHTTWRLAKMNLAIRGIEADFGPQWGDTFTNDLHPDLRADFILANPPFNDKEWDQAAVVDDDRWAYGTPPAGNANYGWLQHMLHHLSPTGTMACVLANGSLTVNSSNQGEIRRKMVDDDVVECIVALPSQLFYSVQIPVSVWFCTKDKSGRKVRTEGKQRDRKGEVLFIDAREMGFMESRTHRTLSDGDMARIADTYNAWRGDPDLPVYEDVPGFCASVTLADVAAADYALSPGRYVGTEEAEDDGEPIEEKLARLTEDIEQGFAKRAGLQETITGALRMLAVTDE